jgi:hypothetical protein
MYRRKIFNHDIMSCTDTAVSGNYLYCGRVLGITEPHDIVQLHPALEFDWQTITAHYERIGLSHSQTPIWDISLNRLTAFPDYDISVFYFGDANSPTSDTSAWFHRLDAKRAEIVSAVNCKNQFIQLAEELGVAVPKTLRFRCKTEIQFGQQLPYPCYVKLATSVNGVGIYRCENELALRQVLLQIVDQVPLQIQQEVVAAQFLNLQYHITEQGAEPLAATEQLLNGCAHIGNRYPTCHQPWDLVAPIANWMAARGMQEIFAFDLAVVTDWDQTRYYAIECNPRFNGASYPTGIARKLKLTEWTNQSFKTTYRSLAEIDLAGLEYDPSSGTGVILVNWGAVQIGKLGVLMAGSAEQQQVLRSQLQQRLLQPQLV